MKKFIVIFLFALSFSASAQYAEKGFGLSLNYNYTSSSELFTFPNSTDRVLRTVSLPMESVYSPGIDLRYKILDEVVLGISFERMKKRIGIRAVTAGTQIGVIRTEVQDEYTIYPLEFNVFYLIPFSTERFKFHLGGGGAIYFGNHKVYFDEFPGLEIKNESKDLSYGIQVSTGMDYVINNNFSVRGEMRFRDPEILLENPEKNRRIEYEGGIIIAPQEVLESKINVDGVTFSIGLVFHL